MRAAFAAAAFCIALRASGRNCECDEGADVVFIQDLQNTMERDLEEIEDEIDDVMDELEDIFRHPRFGLVTFKEVDRLGCVDVVQPLTRNDDVIENIYKRLKARTPANTRHVGCPLAGLLAGLAWEDLDWKSDNRIIILITNNMPSSHKMYDAWPAGHSHECHRIVQPPEELVLDYAKLSGTAILFVIPHAPDSVVSYWKRFNVMLGQHANLLTTSTHDLDDWVEDLAHFFRRFKAHNCFSDDFRVSSAVAEASSRDQVTADPGPAATTPTFIDPLLSSGFPYTFHSASQKPHEDSTDQLHRTTPYEDELGSESSSKPYIQWPVTSSGHF